jgi:hypothetical protein
MKVLIDKTFDGKSLGKYDLCLCIGNEKVVANVSKTKSNIHLAIGEGKFGNKLDFKDFPLSDFINTLKSSSLKISKSYGSVSISISNTLFSFIPKALFQEKSLDLYVKLNTQIKSSYDFRYKTLEKEGIIVCFAVPKNLNSWIEKVFPNAKLTHEIAIFTESVLRDFYSLSENRVIINIHKNHFDIISLEKGQLKFINSFLFKTKEDLLYYILYAFEQLEINPNLIEVFLLGEIKKGDEIHQLIFQYIKNINFGFRNKNIKITGALNQIPKHTLYSIFNQSLCV